jgi:hypothetical protein
LDRELIAERRAMAIDKRVRIMCWGTGDGLSRSFSLDLLADPYWVGSAEPGGVRAGRVANWSADKPHPGQGGHPCWPTNVAVVDGCDAASLSGTTVTRSDR